MYQFSYGLVIFRHLESLCERSVLNFAGGSLHHWQAVTVAVASGEMGYIAKIKCDKGGRVNKEELIMLESTNTRASSM